MSKKTHARKCERLGRLLEEVHQDIWAIKGSPERRAGSQLASALGVENRSHDLRADKARAIMNERGFTGTLEVEGLTSATLVARSLQLFGGVHLRDLIVQRRSLEVQLRQMTA